MPFDDRDAKLLVGYGWFAILAVLLLAIIFAFNAPARAHGAAEWVQRGLAL